jgi:hypothetical protein
MIVIKKIMHSDAYEVNIYKEGVFWTAYEQSAYYFLQQKGYKSTKKFVKSIRQEIVSCGFPQNALDLFVYKDEKNFVLTTDEPNQKTFRLEEPIDIKAFEDWKSNLPLTPSKGEGDARIGKMDTLYVFPTHAKMDKSRGESKEVLDKILTFPLADKTPMECMIFLSGLQKELINA